MKTLYDIGIIHIIHRGYTCETWEDVPKYMCYGESGWDFVNAYEYIKKCYLENYNNDQRNRYEIVAYKRDDSGLREVLNEEGIKEEIRKIYKERKILTEAKQKTR